MAYRLARAGNDVVQQGAGYVWLGGKSLIGPKTRTALAERLTELREHLNRRNPSQLKRALAALFAMTKPNATDRADPEALVDLYAAKLSDLPVWAVMEACNTVARGRGESTVFAPPLPELYRLAELAVEPWRRELAKVSAVLSAKEGDAPHEPTPEERERVIAGFERLSSSLARSIEKSRAG